MTTLTQSRSSPPRLARSRSCNVPAADARPVTRLMSPSDLGRDPEAFRVSRSFQTMEARPSTGPSTPLRDRHPDWLAEGAVSYTTPTMSGARCGRRRRMDAGRRGMCTAAASTSRPHGGLPALDRHCRRHSNGPDHQPLPGPDRCPARGPVRVLLGRYGSAAKRHRVRRRRSTISRCA